MKAINLYNEIADGTPVKKIKYKSYEFEYDEQLHDYYCHQFCKMGWLFNELDNLNEEVEIIEEYKDEKEDKGIKKLILATEGTNTYIKDHEDKANYILGETKVVINKLNEVIERLNMVIENEENSINN